MALVIAGSGGGGGGGKGGKGGRTPSESSNTLFSGASAKVLFALSEGIIEGWRGANPLKSIYLDDTPIVRPDDQENFEDVSYEFRSGTAGQTPIPEHNEPSQEIGVGVTVVNGTPVTRTINSSTARAVSIRLRFPQLYSVRDNGDIKEASVNFRLQISTDSGPFLPFLNGDYTVSGKTNSPYVKSYRVQLPVSTLNRWDLRVTRVSPDSDSAKQQDEIIWEGYTTFGTPGQDYEGVALLGIKLESEQFQSIPSVAVEGWGMQFLVPHNYDPFAATYSGAFNGSLVRNWTNNPAWVLYGVLTDNVWGAGIPASNIDVYSFYSAAGYCDEVIADGLGGFERRYRFNAYINSSFEAYDLITQVAQVMRAQVLWDGSKVILNIDRPKTPSFIYNPSNVVAVYDAEGKFTSGLFEYSTTDVGTRYNACEVRYLNPETWEEDTEYYEDAAQIARHGYKKTTRDAFGCTSRGQAYRLARWEVYTATRQVQLVRFDVADDGILLAPGDVVYIADPLRAVERMGGRLIDPIAAGARRAYLDDVPTLGGGLGYNFKVFLPSGAIFETSLQSAAADSVELVDALPEAVPLHYPWVIESAETRLQQFQIVKVAENEDGTYEVEAANYEPGKFAFVEDNIALPAIPLTNSPNPLLPPPPPTNVEVFERLEVIGGFVEAVAQVYWGPSPSPYIEEYIVEARGLGSQLWGSIGRTSATNISWGPLAVGGHEFRVRGVSSLGLMSDWASATVTLVGKTAPPGNVLGFTLESNDNITARLDWAQTVDLDVFRGGNVLIYHTASLAPTAAEITAATLIGELLGNATTFETPFLPGTYLARFRDSSNIQSVATAQASTAFLLVPPENVRGLVLSPNGETADLSWLAPDDAELLNLGTIELRYTPLSVQNPTWESGQTLVVLPASVTSKAVPFAPGIYMAKFVNVRRIPSVASTGVSTTGLEILDRNVIAVLREVGWSGQRRNCQIVDGALENSLLSGWALNELEWQNITADWQTYFDPAQTFMPQRAAEAIYSFDETTTLGVSGESLIYGGVDFEIELDLTTSVPAGVVPEGYARLEVAPVTATGLGTWMPVSSTRVRGLGYRFRIVLTAQNPHTIVRVRSVEVTVDVPDRSYFGKTQTAATGFVDVNFDMGYIVTPEGFAATIQDWQDGDSQVLFDAPTKDGVRVAVKNGVNFVARTVSIYTESY